MKSTILLITILVSIFSCKTDKKNNIETNVNENSTEQITKSTFEKSLLDLREVNQKFNNQYKVEKFGIKKKEIVWLVLFLN